jgi:hypothetical protein
MGQGQTVIDGVSLDINMGIWDELCTTDPDHTKPVRFGSREFTAVDSQWQVRQMTRLFGPIGKGWGYESEIETIQASDGDWVMLCSLVLWWKDKDTTHRGGPIVTIAPFISGGRVDKDAGKKSITDALTKAMSHLGMSADVFLGQFDDNAYVEGLISDKNGGQAPTPTPTPTQAKEKPPASRDYKNDGLSEGVHSGLVHEVTTLKTGGEGDKSWTLRKIVLDNVGSATTFDSGFAAIAAEAKNSGQEITISVKEDKYGAKIETIDVAKVVESATHGAIRDDEVPF